MPVVKPVKSGYFVKYLHAGLYNAAAKLDWFSSESLWNEADVRVNLTRPNCFGYMICDFDTPVGFVVYEQNRMAYLTTLVNLVVHPDYRRQGIGTMLMNWAKLKLIPPLNTLCAELRESNLTAHVFLRQNDFAATGVERKRFGNEDAYYFEFVRR